MRIEKRNLKILINIDNMGVVNLTDFILATKQYCVAQNYTLPRCPPKSCKISNGTAPRSKENRPRALIGQELKGHRGRV